MEKKTESDDRFTVIKELKLFYNFVNPNPDQKKRLEILTNLHKEIVEQVFLICPENKQKALSIKKLKESLIWCGSSLGNAEDA